jgi:hypothetical protein
MCQGVAFDCSGNDTCGDLTIGPCQGCSGTIGGGGVDPYCTTCAEAGLSTAAAPAATINVTMRNRFMFGTPMCPSHPEMGLEADRAKRDYANVFGRGKSSLQPPSNVPATKR